MRQASVFLMSLAILGALCATLPARGAEPVGLIFDTDICGDCDDALALGMIHASSLGVHAGCWPSPSASTTTWPRRSWTP